MDSSTRKRPRVIKQRSNVDRPFNPLPSGGRKMKRSKTDFMPFKKRKEEHLNESQIEELDYLNGKKESVQSPLGGFSIYKDLKPAKDEYMPPIPFGESESHDDDIEWQRISSEMDWHPTESKEADPVDEEKPVSIYYPPNVGLGKHSRNLYTKFLRRKVGQNTLDYLRRKGYIQNDGWMGFVTPGNGEIVKGINILYTIKQPFKLLDFFDTKLQFLRPSGESMSDESVNLEFLEFVNSNEHKSVFHLNSIKSTVFDHVKRYRGLPVFGYNYDFGLGSSSEIKKFFESTKRFTRDYDNTQKYERYYKKLCELRDDNSDGILYFNDDYRLMQMMTDRYMSKNDIIAVELNLDMKSKDTRHQITLIINKIDKKYHILDTANILDESAVYLKAISIYVKYLIDPELEMYSSQCNKSIQGSFNTCAAWSSYIVLLTILNYNINVGDIIRELMSYDQSTRNTLITMYYYSTYFVQDIFDDPVEFLDKIYRSANRKEYELYPGWYDLDPDV